MAFTADIDFKQYGINFTLEDGMTRIPESLSDNLCMAVKKNNHITFTKPDGNKVDLDLLLPLGAGSYGEVWTTKNTIDSKTPLIVKIIDTRLLESPNKFIDYQYDFIQECLTQIIIYEATKDLDFPEINLKGPFAPKVFLIGRDANKLNFYIVCEKLDNDIAKIMGSKIKVEPTGKLIRTTMLHISKILMVLLEKLNFNHRDLKPDNIMYKQVNDEIQVRLIDFGFSCLTYKSLVLSPRSPIVYASRFHCNSKIRDMHFYIYYLLNYSYYTKVNCPIKRLLSAIIANDSPSNLKMPDVYNIYNVENSESSNLKALNAGCDVVHNIFNSLQFNNKYKSCSYFNSDWTQFLKKMYKGNESKLATSYYLTDEELNHVPIDVKFEDYLDKISDRTPLMDAILHNNLELVKDIVNTPGIIISKRNNKGLTCLHFASINASILSGEGYFKPEDTNGFKIIQLLVNKYPALTDIKDNDKLGPGNNKYARIGFIRDFIKSKKSWLLFRNPNTERKVRGGRKQTRRRHFLRASS